MEDNVLTIRGETAKEYQDEDEMYLMRERRTRLVPRGIAASRRGRS